MDEKVVPSLCGYVMMMTSDGMGWDHRWSVSACLSVVRVRGREKVTDDGMLVSRDSGALFVSDRQDRGFGWEFHVWSIG